MGLQIKANSIVIGSNIFIINLDTFGLKYLVKINLKVFFSKYLLLLSCKVKTLLRSSRYNNSSTQNQNMSQLTAGNFFF